MVPQGNMIAAFRVTVSLHGNLPYVSENEVSPFPNALIYERLSGKFR